METMNPITDATLASYGLSGPTRLESTLLEFLARHMVALGKSCPNLMFHVSETIARAHVVLDVRAHCAAHAMYPRVARDAIRAAAKDADFEDASRRTGGAIATRQPTDDEIDQAARDEAFLDAFGLPDDDGIIELPRVKNDDGTLVTRDCHGLLGGISRDGRCDCRSADGKAPIRSKPVPTMHEPGWSGVTS